MKKNIKPNKKNINLGLEILRVLLAFWVLVFHCGEIKSILLRKILIIRAFHVPTFIIISFYFSFKIINNKNIIKIKERFIRLLFPYIIWPLIIWIFNNILYFLNLINKRLEIRLLIQQLLIGRSLLEVLWYQFNVIFITIIFVIISFLFHNKFLFILQIISLLSYMMQYSYYNYIFFNRFKNYICLSIGLIINILPIAVTGFCLSSIELIQLFNKNSLNAVFLSFLSLFIVQKYDIFCNFKGFFYQGILMNISSILVFIIFSQISFTYSMILIMPYSYT